MIMGEVTKSWLGSSRPGKISWIVRYSSCVGGGDSGITVGVNRVTDCLIILVSRLTCVRCLVEEVSISTVFGVRFGWGNGLSGKCCCCRNVDRIARMSFLCFFLFCLYFIFRLAR